MVVHAYLRYYVVLIAALWSKYSVLLVTPDSICTAVSGVADGAFGPNLQPKMRVLLLRWLIR